MSKTILPRIREARLRLAKVSIRQAIAAFRSGRCEEARFSYLEASSWFALAGERDHARRAERIGTKVVAFQAAGGGPIGVARRPSAPARFGRLVSFNGRNR